MSVRVNSVVLESMLPITADIGAVKIAGKTIAEHIAERLVLLGEADGEVAANFFPSELLLRHIESEKQSVVIFDRAGEVLVDIRKGSTPAVELTVDADSLVLRYPWDLLALCEHIVGAITAEIMPMNCYTPCVDGVLQVGAGTRFLPGVYIEGKVVIGKNCKIGPNCYIRGNTSIGDNCHIGQSVEVKNSLIQDKVSIGHLSYFGDSVIMGQVNFGAGAIVGNLRHDNGNHRSMVKGILVDTGRRKFGTIVGEKVHTGIHTSIYPGRKLFNGVTTRPGEIVDRDKTE